MDVKKRASRQMRGWIPDLPDPRDLTLNSAPLQLLTALANVDSTQVEADLREYFTEVEDSDDLPATVALACGSVVEYFRRRCLGRATALAKEFLHESACRLHGCPTDLSIRQVLVALRRVGLPPASLYAQALSPCDPLLFTYASDYSDLRFLRIDAPGVNPQQVLQTVRALLQVGIPAVFGMPILAASLEDEWLDCRRHSEIIGAAAGVFVGFDQSTRRALDCFHFRSSWGTQYGQHGYGRMTYRFCETLVRDVWIVFHSNWLMTGDLPHFGLRSSNE